MIIPSYLSKVLEFDAVIVSNASAENYTEDELNFKDEDYDKLMETWTVID